MHKRVLVSDLSEINNAIIKIRNCKEGFVTNFFLDESKHQFWIDNSVFYVVDTPKVVLLFKKGDGYCNVYYIATSISELTAVMDAVHTEYVDEKWFVEVVGRDVQCEPILKELQSIDYKEYNCLKRMVMISSDAYEEKETCGVEYASKEDAEEIDECLHTFFNEKIEQLPLKDELTELISRQCVIKCMEDNKMLGFLIFEVNASTIHLRYWFTLPEHRNKKVGSRLLNRFFAIGKDTKRRILWVLQDNENAIKKYEHYGFTVENMNDYILTK